MQPEDYAVRVNDDQTKKMVRVYRVNVSGEYGSIYCRTIDEVKGVLDEFLDGDSYLEDMQRSGDFDWRFDIETVFISEAELNALEPFDR